MITIIYLAIIFIACILQYIQAAFLIALTPRKSPTRTLSTVLLCGCFAYQIRALLGITHCLLNKIIAGNVLVGSCTQNIYFVCAIECDSPSPSPRCEPQPEGESKQDHEMVKLHNPGFVARMKTSLRLIHFPQEAYKPPTSPRGSPSSSTSRSNGNGNEIPRARFLLRQTASILHEAVIQELIWRGFRRCFDARWQEHFASTDEFLILGAGLDQLAARVGATFLFWAGTYCLLDAAYRGTSILSVAVGLSRPADWPPLFGSIGDAYSVRNFWGKFWHQLLRHPLIFFSKAATRATTRILPPRLTKHQRTISLFYIFMTSGLAHSLTDIQYRNHGLTHTFPALRFFIASFLAFVLETAWIRAYRACRSKAGKRWMWFYNGVNILPGRVVERIAGYVWVVGWFCALSPSMVYPPLRALEGKGSLLLQ